MSNQKRQQEVDSSDIDLVQNCSAVDILEAKIGQMIRSLTILKKQTNMKVLCKSKIPGLGLLSVTERVVVSTTGGVVAVTGYWSVTFTAGVSGAPVVGKGTLVAGVVPTPLKSFFLKVSN